MCEFRRLFLRYLVRYWVAGLVGAAIERYFEAA
jgi:hypothetical protein